LESVTVRELQATEAYSSLNLTKAKYSGNFNNKHNKTPALRTIPRILYIRKLGKLHQYLDLHHTETPRSYYPRHLSYIRAYLHPLSTHWGYVGYSSLSCRNLTLLSE
jgi:hypothetical protein